MNQTIVKCNNMKHSDPFLLAEWYSCLNRVCKKLGTSLTLRNSVPQAIQGEKEIQIFIEQLQRKSEVWRSMKLVILGHGRIGKTTLLQSLRQVLAQNYDQKVFFHLPFPHTLLSLLSSSFILLPPPLFPLPPYPIKTEKLKT
jgi:hypothetical protein